MSKVGIEKTLQLFDDLGTLVVSGISLAKTFTGRSGIFGIIGAMGKLSAIGLSIKHMINDLPGAMPELLDLDADEAQKIGGAAYKLTLRLMEAAKI